MIILCWGPLLSARLVPKSSIFTPKTSNLEHELSRNLFLLFLPLAANWSLTDQCFQNEKAVSLDSRYEGTKSFTPSPQEIGKHGIDSLFSSDALFMLRVEKTIEMY